MKITHFALLGALIVLAQMRQGDCERQKERNKERASRGKGGRPEPGASDQNRRAQKTHGQKGSLKGKFVNKEKAECTWALNEAETTTLKVDCKVGESSFSCEFAGNPSTCPQYSENRKAFWKQITRSLKKQKKICEDPKSILKSKICKRGPSSAHFRLITSQSPKEEMPAHHGREATLAPMPPAASEKRPEEASRDCVDDIDYVDQKKVAEQYCSDSWLSLCNFFISMIQDKKCK
ncbi:fibroblast growth factor-binding protein 1 [Hemicordylus capensis]|uniref:fibroblast growth factor-binding protein 1 n=1 Tax=Hemicordylus capensis TaxID=884348 RepID=UPI002303E80D|nr:fibroblast growth factor-binding protein 1 [Hemicordylus capensis]XP_053113372.1 fibroblast growth factor-binding protein 1 [Hemicordylus capensis]